MTITVWRDGPNGHKKEVVEDPDNLKYSAEHGAWLVAQDPWGLLLIPSEKVIKIVADDREELEVW
ncbi:MULTISPECIES: hypothetical protein [Haloferax]|uniref:Uncharacterized protein n=1 Tax=Haloferax mediterranei (strain ATCC 33500 / DSM 1411 / JCM 8866 / NBRC 14739 / NCIMB 2177 / R-4) TaxID=523841 RepID=I3R300_HALMT|nr:hypothetical protein [Haloferax mediterranei]AFK18610.1 hypothetical protein HFX_0889 [Haloferax mediterranei ATCC 33500]EMA02115.1 hypothetical protein C439_06030 [Haloferax mediterranei ATCC 33500]MDX5988697.1 hypothetical protein [Haloferax mediterranei ATCC 33500]